MECVKCKCLNFRIVGDDLLKRDLKKDSIVLLRCVACGYKIEIIADQVFADL